MKQVIALFKQFESLSDKEKIEFTKRFSLYIETGNKAIIENPNYFSAKQNNYQKNKIDFPV